MQHPLKKTCIALLGGGKSRLLPKGREIPQYEGKTEGIRTYLNSYHYQTGSEDIERESSG